MIRAVPRRGYSLGRGKVSTFRRGSDTAANVRHFRRTAGGLSSARGEATPPQERRRLDRRAPRRARARRRRDARRPRAVRERGRVGDRPRGDPRLGRRAADLARRRTSSPTSGDVVETGRADEAGRRPARAHRGRADRVGAARRARRRGVGRLPHARRRRPDHARVVLRLPRRDRRARRSRAGSRRSCRRCRSSSARADIAELSRYALLREVKTHVVGPMCHVLWRWTTGDAVGPNMMTRNAYALNMAFVKPGAPVEIERVVLEANMGGDKKPSYEYFQSGHGKTVIAETTLTDEAIRRVLRTHRRGSRGARLGRHARRRRLGHAVGRVHARVGDRRDLRRDGPGPRHGRHELDGARHRPAGRRRAARLGALPRPRGRHRRRRHDAPDAARVARR